MFAFILLILASVVLCVVDHEVVRGQDHVSVTERGKGSVRGRGVRDHAVVSVTTENLVTGTLEGQKPNIVNLMIQLSNEQFISVVQIE